MAGIPLRFIHASDLHLELPVHGMDEVPQHMADALIDAPYDAARRLFDTAVSEPVDFVVFAGDVYHPHSGGARALDFLVRQFQRLAEANIRIYWAGGLVDPSGRLPSVCMFGSSSYAGPRSTGGGHKKATPTGAGVDGFAIP